MKILLLAATLFLFHGITSAQLNLDWAVSMGSPSGEGAADAVVDDLGNVYVVGGFFNTVDFDPSTNGVFNLTSNGGHDFFVQKLDPNGNFIWAISIGGSGDESAAGISQDNNGDLYITGYYENTVNFDPGGTANITSVSATKDIYILKLNSNGGFIWAKSVGGSGYQSEVCKDIENDSQGNVIITGYFHDTADFDPDPNSTYNLTTQGNWWDAFVLKLDSNGDFLWAKSVGQGNNHETATSVAITSNDDVLICGSFYNTVDFDPSPTSTYNLTVSGHRDMFTLKLDQNGDFVWAKAIGSFAYTLGQSYAGITYDMAIDDNDNSYLVGLFKHSVDFDPGPGQHVLTANSPNGHGDCFIQKMNPSGDFVWAKSIGNSQHNHCSAITIGPGNEIYFTGKFNDTCDLDPSPNSTQNYTATGTALFLEKIDTAGNFEMVEVFYGSTVGSNINTTGDLNASSIVLGPDQSIHVTGSFIDTVDFDPGNNIHHLISNGITDAFVMKLSTCGGTGVDSVISCGPFTWLDGNTYTTSNTTATYTITDTTGQACDSTVTLNLTIEELNPEFSYTLTPECGGVKAALTTDINDDVNYNWTTSYGENSSSNSPAILLPYNGAHSISLEVEGNSGCTGTTEQTINIKEMQEYFEFIIPNVFTPNNDGNNDQLSIDGTQVLSSCSEISIYNRWGKIVHQIIGEEFEWDGKLKNGDDVPEGTYFYIINYGDLSYSGEFTLMR